MAYEFVCIFGHDAHEYFDLTRSAICSGPCNNAVFVLAVEGFEPRHLEVMPFERRDIADKKVPALTPRHRCFRGMSRPLLNLVG